VLTPVERAAELIVRHALAGSLTERPPGVVTTLVGPTGAADATPGDSLAWARATAGRLRASAGGRYRGVAPVAYWGTVRPPSSAEEASLLAAATGVVTLEERSIISEGAVNATIPIPVRGSRARAAQAGERGTGAAALAVAPGANARPRVPHAQGAPTAVPPATGARDAAARYESQDAGEPAGAPDGPRDAVVLPPHALERTVEERPQPPSSSGGARGAVAYPEWDCTANRYRPRGATVRERPPAEGDPAWAATVLREHAALVRRVRQHFEKLRAQRTRLGGQRDGDELDLAACVRSLVDRRTGHTADDRLYVAVRPARRGIAIALLVDVSGSTDAIVSGSMQVIDVEKIALLLASEAL
jgi:nitric oxide reductase NorD protein